MSRDEIQGTLTISIQYDPATGRCDVKGLPADNALALGIFEIVKAGLLRSRIAIANNVLELPMRGFPRG